MNLHERARLENDRQIGAVFTGVALLGLILIGLLQLIGWPRRFHWWDWLGLAAIAAQPAIIWLWARWQLSRAKP